MVDGWSAPIAEMCTTFDDARRARRLADGARPEGLHGVEGLPARLGQDADEIDHRVGAFDRAVDRPAIAEIRLDRLDLPDHAERLQVAGEIGTAHRHADAVAALRQRLHDIAADEARAAEDGDELGGGCRTASHSRSETHRWRCIGDFAAVSRRARSTVRSSDRMTLRSQDCDFAAARMQSTVCGRRHAAACGRNAGYARQIQRMNERVRELEGPQSAQASRAAPRRSSAPSRPRD